MKNTLKLILSAGLLILATGAFAQTDSMQRRPQKPSVDDTLRPKNDRRPNDTARRNNTPDKQRKNNQQIKDKSNSESPKNPTQNTVGIKED